MSENMGLLHRATGQASSAAITASNSEMEEGDWILGSIRDLEAEGDNAGVGQALLDCRVCAVETEAREELLWRPDELEFDSLS